MPVQKSSSSLSKSHENHCADCEKDIAGLKKDIATITKENESLKKDLALITKSSDSLKKELDEIKKQLKELSDKPAPVASAGKDPRVDKILKVLSSNGSFKIKYSAPD